LNAASNLGIWSARSREIATLRRLFRRVLGGEDVIGAKRAAQAIKTSDPDDLLCLDP